MKTISRYIMTLVALFAMTTGAWADPNILVPTITGDREFYESVEVTMICTSQNADIYYTKNGLDPLALPDNQQIEYKGPITLTETTTIMARAFDGNDWSAMVEVTFTKQTGPKVAWNAATKTGTFSMPGSDVVLTPQYAPAAQLDENGKPAAVSGLEIAADAAIITAGQSAQGTLLYAVGTSATEAPALTAFAATLPNAKDQTAAGNYYVWYYIQGHDTPQGQEPTAENTFNDSEIMGPVTVELLTNEHTLNIKQSPNITVTVAGTAKTPTDDKVTPVTTGQEVKIKAKEGYKFRKVEVKKAGAALESTIYSWESPSGTPIETGGTIAYVNGDGDRLNYTNSGHYTICLNGKIQNIGDETASANAGRMDVTLDNALAAGDVISITGYITKNETKQSKAYIIFNGENGFDKTKMDVYAESETFGDESNIDATFNGSITTKTITVPAAAAGCKNFSMTRANVSNYTNLFITKLEIIRGN